MEWVKERGRRSGCRSLEAQWASALGKGGRTGLRAATSMAALVVLEADQPGAARPLAPVRFLLPHCHGGEHPGWRQALTAARVRTLNFEGKQTAA
jgi:hypothetical protein